MSESTLVRPARSPSRRDRKGRRKSGGLREFLASGEAEDAQPQADPEFKRRLREELWDSLQSAQRRRSRPGSD
jgi:hypothetical protein